jgi:hypothetical protein
MKAEPSRAQKGSHPRPDMSSGMIEAWRLFHFYGGGLDAGSISQGIPAAGSIRAAWVLVSTIRCLQVGVLINLAQGEQYGTR